MAKSTLLSTTSWVAHRLEMKESPAWAALPDNARRLLDRLELEHMRHAGSDNGRLICTYDDFAACGIRRASVALAIRQCVALGFLEVTRAGYKAAGEFRVPSHYRLTYVFERPRGHRAGWQDPTDEWKRLSIEGARAACQSALNVRFKRFAFDSAEEPKPLEIVESGRAGASSDACAADALARLGDHDVRARKRVSRHAR